MTVKHDLNAIDDVRYVSDWQNSCDFIIALDWNATVATIDEIREVKPASLILDKIAASQEHFVEIEASYAEDEE